MKNKTIFSKILLTSSLLIFLCSCSILNPYEENFACRNKDKMGKCINIEQAYDEAKSGEVIYPHFDVDGKYSKKKPQSASNSGAVIQPRSSYSNYKSAEYDELSKLITSPLTPVVRPPKIIKTLVIAYRQGQGKSSILYMPRYVFSILEESDFVMGDSESNPSIPSFTTNSLYGK